MRAFFWVGLGLTLLASPVAAQAPYLHAPAGDAYARHDPSGITILGDGRFLKPLGKHIPLARWPHGLTLSPDGTQLFVASDGVGQLIRNWDSPEPKIAELAPIEAGQLRRRTNAGAAVFSPDGKTLYWSSGDTGLIFVFDTEKRQKIGEIALNVPVGGKKYEDSYAMDVQRSDDGKFLYVADVTNFRVVVLDAIQRRVIGSVGVGRYPYTLAVVGKTVYVTNIGMFQYSAVPDPKDPKFDRRGLTFPPFGFPSKESAEGVEVEGRKIPGLGDPNVPESFSVWGVDVTEASNPIVTSKVKTGLLVGAPADGGKTIGGSAPNFLTHYGSTLYVSNNNNDMIERLRPERMAGADGTKPTPDVFAWKTRIVPSPLVAKLRGVGPAGMCVSPDGKRLYVAETGINAIGVLDTQTGRVLGHLPTAWYPYRVAISKDGTQLFVICFRGFGNGPNAGKEIPKSPFLNMKGVLSVVPIPPDSELKEHTKNVLAYQGIVDKRASRAAMTSPVLPTRPGQVSRQIKYVVFITKENHTYDTIFDRIPGAKHDPSLLRWGLNQKIQAPGQPTLENVAVMTNHNALARQFTVSDNFYMQPEASGVGHRWLVGVMPNNWTQMLYTLGWSFKKDTTAPGRLVAFGSNGSIAPEDYPEAGSMWEHLARNGISFRNYGEGFEFAGVEEGENQWKTGARETVNIPMSKVLFDNTCREFPIFNMNIPDQYRADWFIKDFTELFIKGNQEMPRFINIAICNDHGDRLRPDRGYPYMASWMADNDLALGRIVDFLSHTKYWKNMAIFVTQDDSGGEPDHVDAQRSVLLVISPWAKRGYVSHRHTTILSMHRTLYQILGLPPLNLFDATANDLSDCFTTKPDFSPYAFVPVDKRIFDPAKARDPNDPDYQKARLLPSILRDDAEDEENLLKLGEGGGGK
jgi:YVTN family beta-propeller protein